MSINRPGETTTEASPGKPDGGSIGLLRASSLVAVVAAQPQVWRKSMCKQFGGDSVRRPHPRDGRWLPRIPPDRPSGLT